MFSFIVANIQQSTLLIHESQKREHGSVLKIRGFFEVTVPLYSPDDFRFVKRAI
jgi:hypothetical protein